MTRPRPKPAAPADTSSATTEPVDLVGSIQKQQADYDRLMSLCQSLNRSGRCPGRCVFTGELRRDGLAVFQGELDGRYGPWND